MVGCAHGEVADLFEALEETEKHLKPEAKISLVICCGDFQACRNHGDLETMACPPKYRSMSTFHEYYVGLKKAKYLTLFIGGNHEASNHLSELPYGGWVAPNIYYLGHSGCVRVGNLTVAGLSGIFKEHDHLKGRYERIPYDGTSMRSVFHVKRFEVRRLELLPPTKRVDVFISHDWPNTMACAQNLTHPRVQKLMRQKPFFKQEIEQSSLGSPANAHLLRLLKPRFWFAAHMHVKFALEFDHHSCEQRQQQQNTSSLEKNPEEIDLDDDDDDVGDVDKQEEQDMLKRSRNEKEEEKPTTATTYFLSLDKILPGRDFLQIVQVNTKDEHHPVELFYDRDWLAIVKATHGMTPLNKHPSQNENELVGADLQSAQTFIEQHFPTEEDLRVPLNFTMTVDPNERNIPQYPKGNPQLDQFYAKLQLGHLPGVTVPASSTTTTSLAISSSSSASSTARPPSTLLLPRQVT